VTESGSFDFSADRAVIDSSLARLCDRYLVDIPGPVVEAIRYSILGPGKRLRPILLLQAYRAAGGREDASAIAAALEVVHAYSLVHDDLPCMDDDALRRGRPTTHRVFGVVVATAAGLAMVPLAARGAYEAASAIGLPASAAGAIVRELMRASGAGGMVGGQLLDLSGERRPLSLGELERIHRAKTAALIAAAARIGGIAAGTSDDRATALEAYGWSVGLAFQIADDVLDATATSDQLGKTAGRDAVLQKSTYPALLGVDGASRRAAELARQARASLRDAGLLTPELDAIAQFSVSRSS